MARGYWVTFYRSVSNPAAFAEYGKVAGPAIQKGGGRFLARTTATKVYGGGVKERVVVIEFDSVEKAIATIESPEYRAAQKLLEGAAEREIRTRLSFRMAPAIRNLLFVGRQQVPRLRRTIRRVSRSLRSE